MTRRCTVCQHPQRDRIDLAIVGSQEANRRIAAQFGVDEHAVRRHAGTHLPRRLLKAHEAQQVADADVVLRELQRCMERVNLLFDACDRWLRDPANPERYDVGPRAEDVDVIYAEEGLDGKPVRKKARLSELLTRVAVGGLAAERSTYRHADPRELVLKTAGQLQGHLELLAKLRGELDERPQINVLLAPEWLTVRTALLEALWSYPEARTAVAARLQKLEAA